MGDEEREEKLFDRREAESLLPKLEGLLSGAIEKKKRAEDIDREFNQVQNRILLYGGLVPPYGYLAEKKLERDSLVSGMREAVTCIEEIGCVVKDLDLGLIDFPSLLNEEQIYLCWKLGEERIRFWHRMDEGFAGRKPLGEDSSEPTKPN
ncbi:MAG: DUF2203 domain-containing protein [Acidobacteria bacterium]|nr:DUF2203 domain-containing protein [Acidobacteriota bacterium]